MNELVREAREESGLSQRALANRVGVTGSTIQKYEDGKLGVSLDTLKAISDNTGRDLEWFLTRAGYLQVRDAPTPREALSVLTELVERAESQAQLVDLLRQCVIELAGDDPKSWPPNVQEAMRFGETQASPHSAKSGEAVKYSADPGWRRRRKGTSGQDDSSTAQDGP